MDAAFYDAQDAGSNVGEEGQVAAYVWLSRVKDLEHIAVLQPFSPLLFKQGPPKGPARLLRKLSGEVSAEQTSEECAEEYLNATTAENKRNLDPMKEKYLCTSCYLHGRETYMHAVTEFGVSRRDEFYDKLVSQGSWTKCNRCQSTHPNPTRAAQEVKGALSTHVLQEARQYEANACSLCRGICSHVLGEGQHCCSLPNTGRTILSKSIAPRRHASFANPATKMVIL